MTVDSIILFLISAMWFVAGMILPANSTLYCFFISSVCLSLGIVIIMTNKERNKNGKIK